MKPHTAWSLVLILNIIAGALQVWVGSIPLAYIHTGVVGMLLVALMKAE